MQSAAALSRTKPSATSSNLGRYQLIAELARGGMGVVYLAVLRGPGGFHKLVVLKELRRDFLDNQAFVSMFMDEARLAARLNHPHIVQTIEVGADGGRRFIAMEYLDGQPLQQVVQRGLERARRMPLPMHLGILLEVLSALEYAHTLADFDGTPLGLVHRDVSPQNVLVTYEGQIKLVDFGISKTLADVHDDVRGVNGALAGKTRYMAPEQAAGRASDRRADLFSVGVMLWEAIVGGRPWEAQPDAAILQRLSTGAVPRLREAWPDVDPGLAAIVDRAMSFAAHGRYSTALEMREELEAHIKTRHLTLPGQRALGAAVSRLFAEDREERRALIDNVLRAGTVNEPPRSSNTAPAQKAPSAPAPRGSAPWSFRKPRLALAMANDETPSSSTAPSVALCPTPAASGPSRVLPVAAVVIGSLMVIAVLAVERFRVDNEALGRKPAPAALAFANSAAVPVAPTTGAPKMSHVVVTTSPGSAQLFLDELAVPNPYVGDHPRDGTAHDLRVEAPGYESKTFTFSFGEDIYLNVGLAPKQGSWIARPAFVPPPSPTPNCQPPYVVDQQTGKKQWRLECL